MTDENEVMPTPEVMAEGADAVVAEMPTETVDTDAAVEMPADTAEAPANEMAA